MSDVKISGLPAATSALGADELPVNEAGTNKKVTLNQARAFIGEGLTNFSNANQTGFAADQYLAGSSITIPAVGGWVAGAIYRAAFDMVKTAAGVATPIVTVRMGTLGTTGDAAIAILTFAAGTAAIDTGRFSIEIVFRTVGGGTSAVLQCLAVCNHHLAATGLTSTGAAGTAIILATSAGFNSTTQNILGLSFNGGAAFAGTNTVVYADMDKQ